MKQWLKRIIILEFNDVKENISVYWYFPKYGKNRNDNKNISKKQ